MNKIVLAVAVSAALYAGQSFAVVPTINNAAGVAVVDWSTATGVYKAGNTVNEVWISGSSAATPFLDRAVVNDCLSGATNPIYKYVDSGKAAITYVCDSNLVAGTFNVIHKRDGGGSITAIKSAQGILAAYNSTSDIPGGKGLGDFPTLTNVGIPTTCGTPNALGITNCNPIATTDVYATATHTANANFSDVDANQFESALNGGVVNASTVPNSAVATQTFGIAVNTRLRNAMQTAMIAAGVLPGCVVGSELESCMPNLTTEQLTSIWGSNRLTDWGNLRWGGLTGQNLFTSSLAADRPANRNIHLCSRTAGSGTLATLNVKFENAPCFSGNEAIQSSSANTVIAEPAASGTTKVYQAMSGSSDVEDCLVGYNNVTTTKNFTVTANPLPNTYPGSTPSFRWAMGILGTERNAGNTLDYRFIKIDGYSPSAANVAQGKYKFWAELVTVGTLNSDPATTVNSAALTVDLINNVKSANQISTVNVTNANFGITGYLGVANNAAFLPTFNTAINGLISAAFDSTRPVNPYTHEVAAGGNLNHCRYPAIPSGSRAMPALN